MSDLFRKDAAERAQPPSTPGSGSPPGFGSPPGSGLPPAPVSLAEKLRPKRLQEVAGQDTLLASDKPLGRMIRSGKLSSLILWGPPGSGKTTIARLLAQDRAIIFEQASATASGLAEFRKVFDNAEKQLKAGRTTLLFIDEIHRLNRTQQDAFLPEIEQGRIVLAGATTENPSFALSAALLSRARVFVLERLGGAALESLLARAEQEHGAPLPLTPEARTALCAMADGDGRFLLNLAETVFDLASGAEPLDPPALAQLVQSRAPVYDRGREEHYNLISALHKSIRGSDPQAALYWLARMLAAGEDPLYIARRLVRAASEDIGLADPQALTQALAARDAFEFLGPPEGELTIAAATLYLASAPKSNATYKAFDAAQNFARQSGSPPPPRHILNAPTKLMKQLNYGKDYTYDHAAENRFSGQNYFPEGIARQRFYRPGEIGFEREIVKRLAWWDQLRNRREKGK